MKVKRFNNLALRKRILRSGGTRYIADLMKTSPSNLSHMLGREILTLSARERIETALEKAEELRNEKSTMV